jgi:hypothetical protein
MSVAFTLTMLVVAFVELVLLVRIGKYEVLVLAEPEVTAKSHMYGVFPVTLFQAKFAAEIMTPVLDAF